MGVLMRLRCGHTRLVLLTNRYAIKIARIRPCRIVQRFFELYRQKRVSEKLHSYSRNRAVGAMRYVFAGFICNLQERRLYEKYPALPLAPTWWTFVGLINIQQRADPVTQEQWQHERFNNSTIASFADASAKNVGWLDGKLVIIDYGHQDAPNCIAMQEEYAQA